MIGCILANTLILEKMILNSIKKITSPSYSSSKTYKDFENTKKSSPDDLLKSYKSQLRAKGEKALSTEAARDEIKFKYILAHNRMNLPLLANYVLFVNAESVLNGTTKTSWFKRLSSTKLAPLIQNAFKFHSKGHATKKQILKSILNKWR